MSYIRQLNQETITKIKAKSNEYSDVSLKASNNLADTYSDFKNLTSICTSLKNYQEVSSNFTDASADFDVNLMSLDLHLATYFEEPENKTILETLKDQINETKKVSHNVVNSLQKLYKIIEKCWIKFKKNRSVVGW